MRFRKSVKIAKGVRLNLSKTGASFTLGGGKGISVNVGNKGAYLNWSVPGTGVYDRVRLDTLLRDKLGGLFGAGSAEAGEADAPERRRKPAGKAGKTAQSAAGRGAKAPQRPSDEEMDALAQEMALINVHRQAIDVCGAAAGRLDAQKAEAAIEEWLAQSEAPIEFSVEIEALEAQRAVMIDLDLPEIEDMPQGKLVELANGTVKIGKKTKKEQREDYRTCVFGLGEYVASHVLSIVPEAEEAVVSAYTRRRDGQTGEGMDVFIYSVVFARDAFGAGYQERDPYDFCQDLPGRFYVLASGVMKEITPYEAADIPARRSP